MFFSNDLNNAKQACLCITIILVIELHKYTYRWIYYYYIFAPIMNNNSSISHTDNVITSKLLMCIFTVYPYCIRLFEFMLYIYWSCIWDRDGCFYYAVTMLLLRTDRTAGKFQHYRQTLYSSDRVTLQIACAS